MFTVWRSASRYQLQLQVSPSGDHLQLQGSLVLRSATFMRFTVWSSPSGDQLHLQGSPSGYQLQLQSSDQLPLQGSPSSGYQL